jgi:hypothetical protein
LQHNIPCFPPHVHLQGHVQISISDNKTNQKLNATESDFFPYQQHILYIQKKIENQKTCEAQIKLAADAKMSGEAQMKMKRKNREPARKFCEVGHGASSHLIATHDHKESTERP